jgi:type VII secretion EsaA-like protein
MRRGRPRGLVRVVGLLCPVALLALVLLPLNGEYQDALTASAALEDQPVLLSIALVNEDAGATFHDQEVHLGRSYVTQVESDTSAQWQVVSRGVGESGLAAGAYQVLMIIPRDFSATLVDLDSPDPQRIALTYQVNGGGDARLETLASSRGAQVVADLSSQLVDMYVASILGNLRQAQDNVRLLADAGAASTETLAADVTPGTLGLGEDLGLLTGGTDALITADESMRDTLDTLTSALDSSAGSHLAQEQSVSTLVLALEQGAITRADFLEELLAMDGHLLSEGVQALYDELVTAGQALAVQLGRAGDVEAAGVAGHTALVAELQTGVSAAAQGVQDRLSRLDESVLAAGYRPAAVAALDQDGDGVVLLTEVVAAALGPDASLGDDEVARLLRAAAEREVALLPYRTVEDLDTAIAAGVFDHAGGELRPAADEIGLHLQRLIALEADDGATTEQSVAAGEDLVAAVERLVAAEEPAAGAAGDEDTGGAPAQDDAGTTPAGPDLAAAAARYGAEVARLVERYRHAAETLGWAQACEQTCAQIPAADVSAAVDLVVASTVAQQVLEERRTLTASAAALDDLGASGAALAASAEQLGATSRELDDAITAQLAELAALRSASALAVADQQEAARGVARSDALTLTIATQTTSLLTTSESLVESSRSTVEQASRLVTQAQDVRADVDALVGAAAALAERSQDLTATLTGQTASSREFSDTFGAVLVNAHTSGILNERVLEFLVDPVVATPRDPIASADVTRPFPWVLTLFALCLAAACALVKVRGGPGARSAFDRGRSDLLARNARALGRAAVAGVVLGGATAGVSAVALDLPREVQLSWVATLVLTGLVLTLVLHWLVAQWRLAGAGVAVLLLVVYVLVSGAVGTGMQGGLASVLPGVDPLLPAERAMTAVLADDRSEVGALGALLVWLAVAVALGLAVQDDLRRLVPARLRAARA